MELQANLGDFGQLLVTFGDLGKPSNWQNDQLTTDRQMDTQTLGLAELQLKIGIEFKSYTLHIHTAL